MIDPIELRLQSAIEIGQRAGKIAIEFFRNRDSLAIESKGFQDLVSNADRETEQFVRGELQRLFPGDGIVGEEFAASAGNSEFTWVIDPIDGTANFLRGIPFWCVALACVDRSKPVVGVIHDPLHEETFHGYAGNGAYLNGTPIQISSCRSVSEGIFGVSSFTDGTFRSSSEIVAALAERNGMFHATGSGALNLAYVACGRFIGFSETTMMGWDCIAGLLLVAEAGGVIEEFDLDAMLKTGGSVSAFAPGIAEQLQSILGQASKP